jgi:DNA polymerase (family 10)
MGESFKSKMPLREAEKLCVELRKLLWDAGVGHMHVAGSVRRQKPEVGDLDVIVNGDLNKLRGDFHPWRFADGGLKKCTIEFKGRQVNILRSSDGHIGAALLYFTGNATFNLIMRRKAKAQGYKLNEYGLWKLDEVIACTTEQDIFEALGMKYKEPHERSV